MLDHVRGSTLSDGQILGSERHFYMSVCMWVCVFLILIPWDRDRLGVSLLFHFWKWFGSVNSAVAGTCVQDCTQNVHVPSVLCKVQECEIRWRFVEGDNEQSAILTGWALSCKLRSHYTLSDFNHFKLLFLIIPKEVFMSCIWMKLDSGVSLFCALWKKIYSLGFFISWS